jgi:hypothetical protein
VIFRDLKRIDGKFADFFIKSSFQPESVIPLMGYFDGIDRNHSSKKACLIFAISFASFRQSAACRREPP